MSSLTPEELASIRARADAALVASMDRGGSSYSDQLAYDVSDVLDALEQAQAQLAEHEKIANAYPRKVDAERIARLREALTEIASDGRKGGMGGGLRRDGEDLRTIARAALEEDKP